MKTRVVHCRKKPFDVYIGRAFAEFTEDSPFCNHYRIGEHGTRLEVIERFRLKLKRNPKLVKRIKKELKGKVLGCWCSPKPCHGDILVAICEGRRW